MKKYIIILKSGFYLKCTEKATFDVNGKMYEQKVEVIRNDGFHMGDSNDFSINMSEISMSYWIS